LPWLAYIRAIVFAENSNNFGRQETRIVDKLPDHKQNLTALGLRQWIALFVVVMLVGGLALFGFLGADIGLPKSAEAVTEHIKSFGVWGQLAIVALMIVHSFIPFPAEFVALAAGVCFGFVHGTVLTWSGAMTGAFVSFWITKYFCFWPFRDMN